MRFASFYHESTGWNGRDFSGPVKLIPACGSDSVLWLDARKGLESSAREARDVCRRRGFKGFAIETGARYTTARIIRALEVVSPLASTPAPRYAGMPGGDINA